MVSNTNPENLPNDEWDDEDGIRILDFVLTVSENLKLLILGPLSAGLLTLAFSFVITPTFTAKTSILPPNPRSNSAAQLLDNMGGLGVFAGGALAMSDPSQQYIAYINSFNFKDLIIEKYDLRKRYEQEYIQNTRKILEGNIEVTSDKKSGLITIEVSDDDPNFSAQMANGLVAELRLFTGRLELQEAQNRRAFLEAQIKEITSRPFMDAISQQMLVANLIRQYELAKIDEGRVGPTFTQVDVATVPEFKSKPRRGLMVIIVTLAVGILLLTFVFFRKAWLNAESDPHLKKLIGRIDSNLRLTWPLSCWIKKQK
jgi:uncharacterized protein involved in exopolysaccharide biosynthesis